MAEDSTVGSHAVLLDGHARFVSFIGEVIENSDILKVRNIYDTRCYNKRAFMKLIEGFELKLFFLSPTMRLPVAPVRVLDKFYAALPEARLS
jgi:hypothetical protein